MGLNLPLGLDLSWTSYHALLVLPLHNILTKKIGLKLYEKVRECDAQKPDL